MLVKSIIVSTSHFHSNVRHAGNCLKLCVCARILYVYPFLSFWIFQNGVFTDGRCSVAGTGTIAGNAERFGKQRRKRGLHAGYEFHDVGQGPNRSFIGGDESTVPIRKNFGRSLGVVGNNCQVGTGKRSSTWVLFCIVYIIFTFISMSESLYKMQSAHPSFSVSGSNSVCSASPQRSNRKPKQQCRPQQKSPKQSRKKRQ